MIKAIIIDDEPLARSIIREYLAGYSQIEVVEECGDGFEGFKAIQKHQPHLVFLDIQMPKITGLEMLELVEQPLNVIFTTAFDDYALKAFENNAVDYLLKPFSLERFDKAIRKFLNTGNTEGTTQNPPTEKMLSEMPPNKNRLVVKKGSNIKILPIAEVHYLEAYDDYVKIHTPTEVFLKKKTLSHFESTLEEKDFVRIHRSFLVNISQVTRVEPMEKDTHIVVLKSGVKLPVSKTGYGKLKLVLGL